MISEETITDEKSLHTFLKAKGFVTNYRKLENENGVDVIALKDGYSFKIEHKRLQKRENGAYRYGGDVNGDILICSTTEGNSFFVVNQQTSMTKTARLIDLIYGDG